MNKELACGTVLDCGSTEHLAAMLTALGNDMAARNEHPISKGDYIYGRCLMNLGDIQKPCLVCFKFGERFVSVIYVGYGLLTDYVFETDFKTLIDEWGERAEEALEKAIKGEE